MILFYLNSKVISGHEYMFKRIYNQYEFSKILLNRITLSNLRLLFNRNIIISAGSPRQNLFLIFFASFLCKQVFVYTPFGFDLVYFKIKFPHFKNLIYEILMQKKNISFVTCSNEQKKYLQKRFPGKQIFVVRNYYLNSTKSDEQLNLKKSKIYYVGRIEENQKNVGFFIELKRMINLEIILIGSCSSNSLINKLKISGISIQEESINPYANISTNDLIILPSIYEGAALVVIEAAHLGIPIFLYNSIGNRKITDNPILFENYDELVELISLFEQNDKGLKERILKFRKEVVNEYCIKSFLDDIKILTSKLNDLNEK